MEFSADILIAGAGPAGCAAAYDLARAGKRVLLLDRRNFPRSKACACGLTRKTLAALRYSVDPVIERVCREIVLEPADHSETLRIRTRTPICAMAVRERFDAFCLDQTLAAGAGFKKIESVLALREAIGPDALPAHVELDIATDDGRETLTAPVLIGADGSNGQTRRLSSNNFDPAWYQKGFALEACVPYTVLPASLPGGDHPHDLVFDFAPLPGGYGWLFPKGDHINIGVGAFAPEFNTPTNPGAHDAHLKIVTRDLLTNYIREKLGINLDAIRVSITGQHLGMGGHAYIPRGRVLLAGDAAGLVDPLTGEGIHSAIVSGQAAAAAILSGASDIASAYAQHLRPLQQTLEFSRRAARHFYATPERGFRVMRTPLLRSLVLKTYADGLPHTKLLTTLARLVA